MKELHERKHKNYFPALILCPCIVSFLSLLFRFKSFMTHPAWQYFKMLQLHHGDEPASLLHQQRCGSAPTYMASLPDGFVQIYVGNPKIRKNGESDSNLTFTGPLNLHKNTIKCACQQSRHTKSLLMGGK